MRFVAEGGIELAKELLEKSFGTQKAVVNIGKIAKFPYKKFLSNF
jgi:hypothetical protein